MVTSTVAGPPSNAASTGRSDTVSPTLAACSQIRRPGGRGVSSMPRRSGKPLRDLLAATDAPSKHQAQAGGQDSAGQPPARRQHHAPAKRIRLIGGLGEGKFDRGQRCLPPLARHRDRRAAHESPHGPRAAAPASGPGRQRPAAAVCAPNRQHGRARQPGKLRHPGAARRAGPRGPSGVISTCSRACSTPSSTRMPAAPPFSVTSRAEPSFDDEPCTTTTPNRRTTVPMKRPSRCLLTSTRGVPCAPCRRMCNPERGEQR